LDERLRSAGECQVHVNQGGLDDEAFDKSNLLGQVFMISNAGTLFDGIARHTKEGTRFSNAPAKSVSSRRSRSETNHSPAVE